MNLTTYMHHTMNDLIKENPLVEKCWDQGQRDYKLVLERKPLWLPKAVDYMVQKLTLALSVSDNIDTNINEEKTSTDTTAVDIPSNPSITGGTTSEEEDSKYYSCGEDENEDEFTF